MIMDSAVRMNTCEIMKKYDASKPQFVFPPQVYFVIEATGKANLRSKYNVAQASSSCKDRSSVISSGEVSLYRPKRKNTRRDAPPMRPCRTPHRECGFV